jgi:hypothetical protein
MRPGEDFAIRFRWRVDALDLSALLHGSLCTPLWNGLLWVEPPERASLR